MDKISLLENLKVVRPEIEWGTIPGYIEDAGAGVSVDLGICCVMGGRIFGDSHVAVHEILHAKGTPKSAVLETLKDRFPQIPRRRADAIIYILEELRVERLVMEKGYSIQPDRFTGNHDFLSVAICEIWSLKIRAPFFAKRRAKRIANVVRSYEQMPTIPKEVADWLVDALPKANSALNPNFPERLLGWVTNAYFSTVNLIRRLAARLKRKKQTEQDEQPQPPLKILANPFDPISEIYSNKVNSSKALEYALKNSRKEHAKTSLISKMASSFYGAEEQYNEMTLLLMPAHDPCPPYLSSMIIPNYLSDALISGSESRDRRYARSGRRLMTSRLLSNSSPFVKEVLDKKKVLILLDFSKSMDTSLIPMLETVANLSRESDFDVMAYSANDNEFICHLIYSEKILSHAVHFDSGNGDCVAFHIARNVQEDYDNIIVIGDMEFRGPSPISRIDDVQLDSRSQKEIEKLAKSKRFSVLTPGTKVFKIPVPESQVHVFHNGEELKKLITEIVRTF